MVDFSNEITVKQLLRKIKKLSSDESIDNPNVWYRNQKEHWIGWLKEYEGPGAYGRQNKIKRNARFVYNHVVCPGLLLYLIRAIPLDEELIKCSEKAASRGNTLMEKSGLIRKVVPWELIYTALWEDKPLTIFNKFK